MSLSDTKKFYLDKYEQIKNVKKQNVKQFLFNIYKQDPKRYNFNENFTYPLYDTENIPQFLYHTTNLENLKSIFKHGLTAKAIKSRNFSKSHYTGFEDVVFLTTYSKQYYYHPNVSSGKIRVCVLKIKTANLDKKKICYDQNHMWQRTNSVLMYYDTIPISQIVDIKLDIKKQKLEPLYIFISNIEKLNKIIDNNFSLINYSQYSKSNNIDNIATKRNSKNSRKYDIETRKNIDIKNLCLIKVDMNKLVNSYDGFKFKLHKDKQKFKDLNGSIPPPRDFTYFGINKINNTKYRNNSSKIDLRNDQQINSLIWNSVINVVINSSQYNKQTDKQIILKFKRFLKNKNIRVIVK